MKIVSATGVHGSASTWVFNVARRLLADALGPASVRAEHTEDVAHAQRMVSGDHQGVVIKSHHGGVDLDQWLLRASAIRLLSIRDPRDAVISMSTRFESPFSSAIRWIKADCAQALRIQADCALTLRYEDRFFDDMTTVWAIAAALGVEPSPEAAKAIFDDFRTEAVRKLAADLRSRPDDGVRMVGRFRMDPLTHILEPHISDGRIGKWREMSPPVQDILNSEFHSFLLAFGYG